MPTQQKKHGGGASAYFLDIACRFWQNISRLSQSIAFTALEGGQKT
jgi:hypothetical protein